MHLLSKTGPVFFFQTSLITSRVSQWKYVHIISHPLSGEMKKIHSSPFSPGESEFWFWKSSLGCTRDGHLSTVRLHGRNLHGVGSHWREEKAFSKSRRTKMRRKSENYCICNATLLSSLSLNPVNLWTCTTQSIAMTSCSGLFVKISSRMKRCLDTQTHFPFTNFPFTNFSFDNFP